MGISWLLLATIDEAVLFEIDTTFFISFPIISSNRQADTRSVYLSDNNESSDLCMNALIVFDIRYGAHELIILALGATPCILVCPQSAEDPARLEEFQIVMVPLLIAWIERLGLAGCTAYVAGAGIQG